MSVEQFVLWPALPVAAGYFSTADDNVYKPTAERIMSPANEILSLQSMSLEEKVNIGERSNAVMSFSEDSVEMTLNAFRWSAGNSAFSRLNGGIVSSNTAESS